MEHHKVDTLATVPHKFILDIRHHQVDNPVDCPVALQDTDILPNSILILQASTSLLLKTVSITILFSNNFPYNSGRAELLIL
jgi:hypothetical protein